MTTRIRATATLHKREMNNAERKYSEHLRERLMVGEIRWWAFEAWKFRLADNTYYTPDFIVVTNDMRLEAHEVKAYWKNLGKAGWTDDARVKIKVAAEQHPVRFLAVTLMPDQSWQVEEFIQGREEEVPESPLRRIADALGMIGESAAMSLEPTVEDIVRYIAERAVAPRLL